MDESARRGPSSPVMSMLPCVYNASLSPSIDRRPADKISTLRNVSIKDNDNAMGRLY